MSKLAVYGAAVSVEIVVQLPWPAGDRWKLTVLTPVPPVSVAVALRSTVPPRFVPGSSSVVAGAVRSTVTLRSAVLVWPTLSVAITRSARLPSAGSDQSTEYGEVVSVPIVCQMPAAQSTLVSSHWANETEAMPLPESVALGGDRQRIRGGRR